MQQCLRLVYQTFEATSGLILDQNADLGEFGEMEVHKTFGDGNIDADEDMLLLQQVCIFRTSLARANAR